MAILAPNNLTTGSVVTEVLDDVCDWFRLFVNDDRDDDDDDRDDDDDDADDEDIAIDGRSHRTCRDNQPPTWCLKFSSVLSEMTPKTLSQSIENSLKNRASAFAPPAASSTSTKDINVRAASAGEYVVELSVSSNIFFWGMGAREREREKERERERRVCFFSLYFTQLN